MDTRIDNRSTDIVDENAAPETLAPGEQTRYEHEETADMPQPPSGGIYDVIEELQFLFEALVEQFDDLQRKSLEILAEGSDAQLFEARGSLRATHALMKGLANRLDHLKANR